MGSIKRLRGLKYKRCLKSGGKEIGKSTKAYLPTV